MPASAARPEHRRRRPAVAGPRRTAAPRLGDPRLTYRLQMARRHLVSKSPPRAMGGNMVVVMPDTPPTFEALMTAAAAGDSVAWGALLVVQQDRLCRMVRLRLDPRLRGRVDPADVVQDAYAEATAHRERYFAAAAAATMPLFLWLRG